VASYPGLLGRRLHRVLGGYEAVVGAMTRMPPTLVHGSCRSANVLVDRGRTPPRVCPLDWELAALGPPLHDLAFLADRFERDAAERLCQAYAAEAAGAGLPVPGTARMLEEIERLRLHKVLRSLARSATWAYPVETVTKLVTRAEALARNVA
jgi:aminoglycoside phosphotransferase (APT) family kinase protein